MRRLFWVLAIVGVLLLTAFGIGRLWVLSSLPSLGGRESLPGLADSVTILVDSLAVPHLIAQGEDDLYAALGYVHARDRMFAMDLLRHAALGRLAELFGARAVAADRTLRELEATRIARERVARVSDLSRRLAEAYARGVNAWLDQGHRALEFRLLGHTPEPWAPEHSLAIGVLQSRDLRFDGDELQLAEVAARLGADRARELVPPATDSETVIVADPGRAGRGARSGKRSAVAVPARAVLGSAFRAPPAQLPAASNAWVVGPRRTASGAPILANDPHLTLRAPSLWYLVALHAPGMDVVGGSIPGIPAVVLGHSARVAWGFTNAMVDDADYVLEELNADSSQVRTASGWAAVEQVAETIRVRGGADVVYTRRRTAHGPLVTVGYPDSTVALALRWVAQDGGADELSALHAYARARDYRDFAAAVRNFRSPEQNTVFADADGHIGYFLAGSVPVRRIGTGSSPVRGVDGPVWTRYLAAAELPAVLDPPSGRIVTANNRVVGPAFPFPISSHYDLGYRATRILQLIDSSHALSAADVAREQMDQVDLFARWAKSLAARAALDAGRADLADRLRGWNGAMRADAVEPTLFWTWWRYVRRLTYDDESPAYRPAAPLHRWLAAGGSPWFDDARTPAIETLETVARQAMDSALARGRMALWGERHQTVMDHPLGAIPLLGRLLGFSIGPFPKGGDDYTVNVAYGTRLQGNTLYGDYGPSLRHVVDLADPDGAGGFIIPTGQSGHPLSRHYRDQLPWWCEGKLWILPVDVSQVRARDTLALIPGAWRDAPE